jgi:tetratricopeptide (TPR) repeat protein
MRTNDQYYFHRNLASFYNGKPTYLDEPNNCKCNYRKISEQPWQLIKSEQWQNLVALLKETKFLPAAWDLNFDSIFKYWSVIERESKHRAIHEYGDVLEGPDILKDRRYSIVIAEILNQFGHLNEAQVIFDKFIDELLDEPSVSNEEPAPVKSNFSDIPDPDFQRYMLGLLSKKAVIQRDTGNYETALGIYDLVEEYATKWNNRHALKVMFVNKSTILSLSNRVAEANDLLEKAEQLIKEDKDYIHLSYVLSNRGLNYISLNNKQKGVKLLKEALELDSKFNNEEGIQNILGNLANVFWKEGNLEKAVEYLRLKEKRCREVGNKQSLQVCLGNLALALKDQDKLNEALELLNEQEQLCTEIKNPRGLAYAYGNKALVLNLMNKPEEAALYAMSAKQLMNEYNIIELKDTLILIMQEIMNNLVKPVDKVKYHNESDLNQNLYKKIINLIEQEKYTEAIELTCRITNPNENLENIKGVCLLRTGHAENAQKIFHKLSRNSSSGWQTEAKLIYKRNYITSLLCQRKFEAFLSAIDELDNEEKKDEIVLKILNVYLTWKEEKDEYERSIPFFKKIFGKSEYNETIKADFEPGEFQLDNL